jgi:hypothetical protein
VIQTASDSRRPLPRTADHPVCETVGGLEDYHTWPTRSHSKSTMATPEEEQVAAAPADPRRGRVSSRPRPLHVQLAAINDVAQRTEWSRRSVWTRR